MKDEEAYTLAQTEENNKELTNKQANKSNAICFPFLFLKL